MDGSSWMRSSPAKTEGAYCASAAKPRPPKPNRSVGRWPPRCSRVALQPSSPFVQRRSVVGGDRGAPPRSSTRRRGAPRDEGRPLEGRTIVVTRAAAQAERFTQLLEAAGARVIEVPAIVIGPPASWEPLDAALRALPTFTWLVFTSVNGVAMVDRRLSALGLTWSAITGRRVAAIGPATADALRDHQVGIDIVPAEYRAEGLLERLRGLLTPGDRVLLPRAAQTRDVLVTGLRALGVYVVEVAAYATRRGEDKS